MHILSCRCCLASWKTWDCIVPTRTLRRYRVPKCQRAHVCVCVCVCVRVCVCTCVHLRHLLGCVCVCVFHHHLLPSTFSGVCVLVCVWVCVRSEMFNGALLFLAAFFPRTTNFTSRSFFFFPRYRFICIHAQSRAWCRNRHLHTVDFTSGHRRGRREEVNKV